MNYLDNLNEAQREAVVYKDGPALVIAGAGSGKTRVLTYKIVDLLANGYAPNRILALTFTNKAAREMKERIAPLVGTEVAAKLWMGTFHSIFLRILRRHADLLGFKSGFTIYDSSDSKSLVKMIIKDMGLDDKQYKPSTMLSAISKAKNCLIDPESYQRDPDNYKKDNNAGHPEFGNIFSAYVKRCKLSEAMDFDDILFYMNKLLRDRPDVLLNYQRWFQYILVDEYQDTNFAQHAIISQLAGKDQKVCVVGDDAQSIYSFRGAEISNILTLQNRFPKLKIFKLEQNYRSTQMIVNAAGSLIAKNRNQIPKQVFSKNEKGYPLSVIKSFSDFEEAYLVAGIITKLKMTEHDSYEDYAVLYRTNAQSRLIEEALRKRNIPYRIYGGLAFYQRKEVKDVISYFRLAVNPDDDESLRRVINYPARGIGNTTVGKIISKAVDEGVSMWEVISNPGKYALSVNGGTAKKLAGFVDLIRLFQEDIANGSNAFELGQLVFNRTGILTSFEHDNTPESISKQQNLQDVMSSLKQFVDEQTESGEGDGSMSRYLSQISLATDQDQKDETAGEKVTLMTVHAAKGLEFKHVIITGLEKDLFPSSLARSLKELEEERRLMYVAITRAMKTCHITYAGTRMRMGQTTATEPSPFLSEIDPQWTNVKASGNFEQATKSYSQTPRITQNTFSSKFVDPIANYRRNESQRPPQGFKPLKELDTADITAQQHTADQLQVGNVISHSRFGEGTITEIDTAMQTIMVDFDNVGTKKLMLRYAKFDIIS